MRVVYVSLGRSNCRENEYVCSFRRFPERPGSARGGNQRQDRSAVATGVLARALDGRRHQIDPELAPADAQLVQGELQHRDDGGSRGGWRETEQPGAGVGSEIGERTATAYGSGEQRKREDSAQHIARLVQVSSENPESRALNFASNYPVGSRSSRAR